MRQKHHLSFYFILEDTVNQNQINAYRETIHSTALPAFDQWLAEQEKMFTRFMVPLCEDEEDLKTEREEFEWLQNMILPAMAQAFPKKGDRISLRQRMHWRFHRWNIELEGRVARLLLPAVTKVIDRLW